MPIARHKLIASNEYTVEAIQNGESVGSNLVIKDQLGFWLRHPVNDYRGPFKTMRGLKTHFLKQFPSQTDREKVWDFTEQLSSWLAGELGVDIYIKRIEGVYTTARRDSANYYRMGYGIDTLVYEFEAGFVEYKSLQYLWNHEILKGVKALWAIVLHEMAHAVHFSRPDYVYKKDGHGITYQSILGGLIDRFPFVMFENCFGM